MHYYPAGLSMDNVLFHQPVHAAASFHDEEEPFESTAEIEAQTIGNLLPDEDDLFSEVFNDLEFSADSKAGDCNEDFDLFSSVGGMELEGDDGSSLGNKCLDFSGGVYSCRGDSKGLFASTGVSKQCLMRKCQESEKDGAGLSKSSNDISSSKFGCFVDGSLNRLHSSSNVPMAENFLGDRHPFVLNSLPSSLHVPSAGDHFGLRMPSSSLDLMKFGGQYIVNPEPHSAPDSENNLKYFIPYEAGSTMANMAGSKTLDRNDGRHISVVNSTRELMEPNGGVIGPFGSVTCPVHGHPWSDCYLFHNNSIGQKVWPGSPLFCNGIGAASPPQKMGFPTFYPGSLGNIGPFGSSPLQPLGRGPHIFSNASRISRKSANDVMNSPSQTTHSLGSQRECWRNISRRRNHGSYNHANRKEFELDIERILRGEDDRTTLMLKNIPNKYSSKMLLAAIDEECKGIYDFIYLPIDFKNNCNVGYAFINLIDPLQIIPLYKSFNGKKWEKFNSEKVAALAYARIQGKAALIAHFQNSSLMNEDKRCRPILFRTDGPNAGEQEPFPMGSNIRIKASRARGNVNSENYHHGSPSTSPNSSESDRGSLSPKSIIIASEA